MPVVAFDFETELIKPGLLAPPPICMSYRSDTERGLLHAQLDYPQLVGRLTAWLADPEVIIFGANTAFDVAVSMAEWPELIPLWFTAYDRGRVRDIQLNQQLLDNASGELGGYTQGVNDKFVKYSYSLAGLAKRFLGVDRSTEKKGAGAWRLRYSELRSVAIKEWPEAATSYALTDADNTFDIAVMQQQHAELTDSASQARASLALHLMSCWGIHTNEGRIDAFENTVKLEYIKLKEELTAAGLLRANGTRNTKNARSRMLSVCPVVQLTPKGVEELGVKEASADIAVFPYVALHEDACQRSGDDLLIKYAEITSLHTDLNTRIPDLRKGVDTPIQSRFSTIKASGRTSCSKGKGGVLNGFQLQNPPRNGPVRECFEAREGYYFADADFDGLELCTMAQCCINALGYSDLGQAINAGLDAHLALGAELLRIPYEEALKNKRDPKIKHARQCAKVANFGFPGGLGPHKLVEYARKGFGVVLTLEQALELREEWLNKWTEFKPYFNWVSQQGSSYEAQDAISVTQWVSNRQRGLANFTAACNSYFQGLGADGAKHALYQCTRAAYSDKKSPFYGARPVNFVHDQIIAEVRIEVAHEQATEMARLMIEGCNKYLPDVPTKCTPAISKFWCKNIEAVYDAPGGRLVPWDLARAEKRRVFYPDGQEVVW